MADEKIPKHIKKYVDTENAKLAKEFKSALSALEKRLKTAIVTLDTQLKKAIADLVAKTKQLEQQEKDDVASLKATDARHDNDIVMLFKRADDLFTQLGDLERRVSKLPTHTPLITSGKKSVTKPGVLASVPSGPTFAVVASSTRRPLLLFANEGVVALDNQPQGNVTVQLDNEGLKVVGLTGFSPYEIFYVVGKE